MHENIKKDFIELSKSYFELQKENARLRELLSKLGVSDIPYSCPFAGQVYVKPCPFCGAAPGLCDEDGNGGPRMAMIPEDEEDWEEDEEDADNLEEDGENENEEKDWNCEGNNLRWAIECDCGCVLDSLEGEGPKELWERWNRRANIK
mgnify:CR=1 FL=1